ncbi:MAG: enolase C-terminal domain-like protein [Rhodoferax sp.]
MANYGPALIDRAVLDALCRLQGTSFYAAMQANLAGIDSAQPQFAGLEIPAFLQGLRPAKSIDARHTVGLLDAITAGDLQQRIADGLPETLEEVIAAYGHHWFKLKVSGQLQADIERLCAIASVLDRSHNHYAVSLDGNEQYESVSALAELVAAIQATPKLARLWSSVAFIEQPIARRHALDVDLHGADLGKPVIIDESDGLLDAFVQARARGYAGVSSKTCKGIYRSLLNAMRCGAWNREQDHTHYFMSAEDLTTQAGLAVQQDLALVNLLGITHVERNGHHYVNGMAAQSQVEQNAFLQAHPDLYEYSHGSVRLAIHDGRIQCASLDCTGYASGAEPDFKMMQPLGRDTLQ